MLLSEKNNKKIIYVLANGNILDDIQTNWPKKEKTMWHYNYLTQIPHKWRDDG